MSLTRAKFEQLCDHLIRKTIEPCKLALRDAGLDASQINEVILVGGSTRIPAIQKIVEEFFGRTPNKSVTPTKWWPSAPQFRAVCSRARSRTCCCSTLRRCRWVSRRWAA